MTEQRRDRGAPGPDEGRAAAASAEPGQAASAGDARVAGRRLITVDLVVTGVFGVAALVGIADPDGLAWGTAAVSVGMFLAGCVTFLWAFAIAVGRSRTEVVTLGGVYFLAGSPAEVRRPLLGALAVQVVVALIAGIVRIYTLVAFVALAPMFGLGMAGLWGARYASFPDRGESSPPAVERRRR